MSEMDWIFNNIEPLNSYSKEDFPGYTLAHCFPDIFPRYVKIFHPIYIDQTITNPSITWDELNKNTPPDILNDPKSPEALKDLIQKSTLVYGSPDEQVPVERLLWKDLCDLLALKYHQEINVYSFTRAFKTGSWPRMYIGPREGNMDDFGFANLLKLLYLNTNEQEWQFYFNLLSTINHNSDLIYTATLSEFASLYLKVLKDKDVSGPPNYWFPIDRSCIVYTDIDLTFTLVGCTSHIEKKILDHDELEAISISYDTRIDWYGDKVNLPKD
jgi:hypothetical protein